MAGHSTNIHVEIHPSWQVIAYTTIRGTLTSTLINMHMQGLGVLVQGDCVLFFLKRETLEGSLC